MKKFRKNLKTCSWPDNALDPRDVRWYSCVNWWNWRSATCSKFENKIKFQVHQKNLLAYVKWNNPNDKESFFVEILHRRARITLARVSVCFSIHGTKHLFLDSLGQPSHLVAAIRIIVNILALFVWNFFHECFQHPICLHLLKKRDCKNRNFKNKLLFLPRSPYRPKPTIEKYSSLGARSTLKQAGKML